MALKIDVDLLFLLFVFSRTVLFRGFIKSRLQTAAFETWYLCLFSLRAGSRVWVSHYDPFPGIAAYYTISSYLWKKAVKTPDMIVVKTPKSLENASVRQNLIHA